MKNEVNLISIVFIGGDNYTIDFYKNMLLGLGFIDGVSFEVWNEKSHLKKYDVALLMYNSCDKYLKLIRKINPKCKIGVVDPRNVEGEILSADFAVVQGIEEENFLSDYFFDIFRYDFHPSFPCLLKDHKQKKDIIIGYHGNKVHLHTMCPYLTSAIDELAKDFNVEFWAFFNIESFGHVDFNLFPSGNVIYREFQWNWDIFTKDLINVDIGVVPNLIPIKNQVKAKKKIMSNHKYFNEHESDYLARYKLTSNAGRIYPFAQLGIPVVSDLYPTSCNTIKSGLTGFFGGSAGMWYRSLYNLASSSELRTTIGRNMQEQYLSTASPDVFNRDFAEFLCKIVPDTVRKIPYDLRKAEGKLSDPHFRLHPGQFAADILKRNLSNKMLNKFIRRWL